MNSSRVKRLILDNLLRLALLFVLVLVAGPILWALTTSLKTNTEILTSPWGIPEGLQWDNYLRAVERAHMGQYFLNSIVLSLGSLTLLLFLVIPFSYALSRYRFFGRRGVKLMILAGLFISGNYIVVPLFLLLRQMGTLDSRVMLGIIYAATAIPFNAYLLSGFMKGISHEYEDAARIDGCGPYGTLYRVIVPLAKPGIVTVSLFGFMTFWNEYMLALTLLTTPIKRTLSVGLKNLMEMQKYATDWGAMFAGLVIVMLPTMVFYALVQKKLTEGITLGGIKG